MGRARQPPPLDVRVGQVWKDNDPRNEGRTLRVEEIIATEEGGYARCKVLTHRTGLESAKRTGGTVRIALRRFKPNRNGYSLVSELSCIGKGAGMRAYEICQMFEVGVYDERYPSFIEEITRAFKEHARDQRHLCAEAVPFLGKASEVPTDSAEANAQALSAAHAAVMNAPEPGDAQWMSR